LCGGSGTRLWPSSRKNFPKQFLSFFNNHSLLQETFSRVNDIMPKENIFLVTNRENVFNVLHQIHEIEPDFDKQQILIEPASLNTAPAITYAIKHLAQKVGVNFETPVIFLPADHYIADRENFLSVVKNAMAKVGNFIGTIGITPTKAETNYGYIKKGEKSGEYYNVEAFKEKPNLETATEYLAHGGYLWNSGIYFFKIRTFADELKKHSPEMHNLLKQNFDIFLEQFINLPSISFDYAISEKSDRVVVFEGDFGWSDIGSFDGLADIFGEQMSKNPRHINIDSKNIFIYSPTDRLIATLGVEDLIIVENRDSILVHKRGRGEEVKKIVDHLSKNRLKELEHNLLVHRPWGKYEILIEDKAHQVKKIVVYPGAKLSLQSHYHRVEHWVVVKGLAKIVLGDEEILLRENESTFIPALTRHRLENPGKINLEIIEVQTGSYLGEDDIQRYEDVYNRS
jgi:mannose-1-phosphate guanylyltransferase/mannose-6-phosphate isomerase